MKASGPVTSIERIEKCPVFLAVIARFVHETFINVRLSGLSNAVRSCRYSAKCQRDFIIRDISRESLSNAAYTRAFPRIRFVFNNSHVFQISLIRYAWARRYDHTYGLNVHTYTRPIPFRGAC